MKGIKTFSELNPGYVETGDVALGVDVSDNTNQDLTDAPEY